MHGFLIATGQDERLLSQFELITDNYGAHAQDFVRFVRDSRLPVNYESVKAYFRELNESDYSASTKIVKRHAVKSRIRKLFRSDDFTANARLEQALHELDTDPETRAPKVNSKAVTQDRIITTIEYRALIEGARSDRQRDFVRFLYTTGCRVSEMIGVKLSDCERAGEAVKVRITGKGNKERFVFLPFPMFDEIRETFSGTRYLFENINGRPYRRQYISNKIEALSRRVLHRTISAHTLRHSFATEKIERTHKIQAVSEYLGHSSVSTTLAFYNHETLTLGELFTVG